MVGDDRLYGLLLFLQSVHHLLLLRLLALQGVLLLLSLIEQVALVALGILQLLMLVVHLVLLRLYCLALSLLVGRVLAHEGQAAVHLRQTLGTKDKHQFVLYRVMARHVAHGAYILVAAVLQLLLQCLELRVEHADVAVYVLYVVLYALDVLLLLVYLAVENHQVLQAFFHVGLVLAQGLLLLLYLLLYAGALPLQSADRRIGVCGRGILAVLALGRCLLLAFLGSGFLLGGRLGLLCLSLPRRFLIL